jgi:putative DNA primase/helicase
MKADASPESAEYFTELSMAATVTREVLAERYRWAKGLGWLAWDGRRWADCPDEEVIETARLWMIEQLQQAIVANSRTAGDWLKLARRSSALRAIVGLARGIEGVLTDVGRLDAHPDLLNTPSGVVDLRTGKLADHDPALLLTKITRAAYQPGTHPDWTAALAAIPDDCRGYAQLRYGQAITGHMPPDDVLLVQQGAGENGKSTVMGAIAAALGDYYSHVSDRVVLGNPGDHPTELMDLRGARLALIEETPEARRLSVARLKKLVGTPMITARRIRQDGVTFLATHTLVLSSNYQPIIEETDHGTWRRLLLLRFPYRFRKAHEPLEQPTDRRGDPGLRDRLVRDEVAGQAVLSWLVDGAVAWYAADRVMPEPPTRIVADTLAWRHEADLVLSYLDERLQLDTRSHVMAVDLLADFNHWLHSHGHREWSDKVLVSRFAGHDALRGHVEKRRLRPRDGLSRPEMLWGAMPRAVPEMYTAWSGLRFRRLTDRHLSSIPPNTGPVHGVQGTEDYPYEDEL